MEQTKKNSRARDCFANRIKKSLLGTGAENDMWGLEDSLLEIISDYPLIRYYTGVLFPEKSIREEHGSALEEPVSEIFEKETIEEVESGEYGEKEKEESEDSTVQLGQNNFYPSTCGLTLCVGSNIDTIEVEINFGLYYKPKQHDIRIKIPKVGYDSLIENSAFPLKDSLKFKDGFMWIDRELNGESKRPRSGDYERLDGFRQSDSFKDSSARYYYQFLEMLISPRTWKRKNISLKQHIPIDNNSKGISIYHEEISKTHTISAKLYTKKYTHKGNTYFKVLLANCSNEQAYNRFTNQTNELNRKTFFQTEVIVRSQYIEPYKSNAELNPIDDEANKLNFLYRKVKGYAIGHNCSATWDSRKELPTEVRTTFLPEYQIKDVRNKFDTTDLDNPADFAKLNECLDIYSLSVFGVDKIKIVDNLKQFVGLYGKWIKGQKTIIDTLETQNKVIANGIIENLQKNLDRLYSNIELLNDDTIFRAFTLANTAMLIQIIVSNDERFAKKEKWLDEYDSTPYNELDYFRTYSEIKPAYRPFQLAFILLNIESITNPESDQRNKIVDLIWFPTGGGKTEAYLAVAALSVIWRRLNNEVGYEGTAVIMRYTLRLLTAQQFERASRLIVTLEFIRRNYEEELKKEPISIGLWVGKSSTPNKIADADKAVTDMDSERNKKGNKGDPESKNIFQISSCPWCGAKLINKYENGNWNIDAFQSNLKNKTFLLLCPNKHCAFHKELPIQVVDEMLYKNPPTLLFATVDKFAMLAWQENGHRFFNSLSDVGLPPELIIQDELHLLSGALGSITGIFESVIEMLCTKNSRKPKIIASTATTRNTTHQINSLYGNREVNVFPPTGLSYDDSFFARESQNSRRKYIGFMPTGKTAVDTQLRLLSNLLVARVDIYRDKDIRKDCFDNYWTIVSYYNSLKDVGRTNNKIGDEVYTFTQTLQKRLFSDEDQYRFNYYGIRNRIKELTSREQSGRIKQTLKELEGKISLENNLTKNGDYTTIKGVTDLVLATNMISVGIDISRLNVMLMNGQPKNIAEYIQASSRVGRSVDGLVVTLLDANRARDKSHFEHFIPFHSAFYKSVEPISLTPFTENTIDKMLMSMVVTYIRHKVVGCTRNVEVCNFDRSSLNNLIECISHRFGHDLQDYFLTKIELIANIWDQFIKDLSEVAKYDDKQNGLMLKPQNKGSKEDQYRVVMQSMREIDTNAFVKIFIHDPKIKKNNEQE